MLITKKRKFWGVVSLLVAGCFMLTSCGLLSGKSNKAPEEIESVVTDFLDSIASGDFVQDGYESDLAADTPFADLEFSDTEVEVIMANALEKISYEIDEADGDQKDGEGTCDIVLTAIDLNAVTESLDGKFDAETLEAAIDDKKVPTEDHEITLDLEYDEDEEEWLISDTSELCEILGEPFLTIELSSAVDPMEVATAFIEAVKTGDFETASALTDGYYTEADFIDPNYDVTTKLFEAVFSNMTYEIIEPSTSSETEISYQIDFSYADYFTSVAAISTDVQTMSDLVKPFVLALANYEEGTVEYTEYLNNLGNMVIADLLSSSAIYDDSDTLDLYYDEEQETWFVEYAPYSLCAFYDLEYNVDPMYSIDQTVYDEVMLDAYNDMLADGSITQAQYDEYYAPATEYDAATVLASITTQGWYDYETDAYVTEYLAGVTSLDYDLFFSSQFSGLVLNYEFFSNNGTVSLGVNQVTLPAGADYNYFSYYNDDFSALAADTYWVLITTVDGTVLVDQSISVV